jgi:FHA domain
MGGHSPLARHTSTPAELQARIEADRAGTPYLVLRDGEGAQALVDLGGAVTVGRRPSCDLNLHWDPDVSRLHARLERVGDEWTVVDDGTSRNGTWVNGQALTGRRRLRDGDVLRFGDTAVAYRCRDAESQTPTSTGRQGLLLGDTQRRVLVALCRPYGGSAFAIPASNQRIADELHLSVDAVKAQLRVLFRAFGLEQLPQNEKRAALAARALQDGIVSMAEL